MAGGNKIYIDNQEYILVGPVPSAWTEIQSDNSTLYTISNGLVVWNNGRIVQYDNADVNAANQIIEDGQYTTRAASTDTISVNLATQFPDKWAALTPGEHTIQIRAKNPGNYLDSDLSTAITFVKVVNYTITANLTNCTGVSSNPTTIASNTTATVLTFTANTGYDLPASVTVTGATSSWNQSTGELTLTKPTGNVTITIAATATALYVGEDIIIPQIVRN